MKHTERNEEVKDKDLFEKIIDFVEKWGYVWYMQNHNVKNVSKNLK